MPPLSIWKGRQDRMLTALDTDSYEGLLNELWVMAEEDLASSRLPMEDNNRLTVEASMTKVLKDQKDLEILKLLYSIPERIVRALIDNTVGHKWSVNDGGDFRSLFYQTDYTSGAYLNTIVRTENGGGFLSHKELTLVTAIMDKYIQGAGMDGRDRASLSKEQKELVDLAVEIDSAYGPRPKECETIKGDRYYMSQPRKIQLLVHNLKERAQNQKDSDPMGTVIPIQSPCEVGCGNLIPVRLGVHSTKADMKGTTKPWGFMLSCMRACEIEFHVVALPILKVWDTGQIQLAEILVTMLSGALVEHGGYNITQAGGGREPREFEKEKREVFETNSHLAFNMGKSEASIIQMKEVVEDIQQVRSSKSKKELSTIEAKVEIEQNEVTDIDMDIQLGIKRLQQGVTDLQARRKGVVEMIEDNKAISNFQESLQSWLDD